MDKLKVKSSLFMRGGATFKDIVNLQSARVDGQITMVGSTFEGAVNMDGLEVGSTLLMSGGRFEKAVKLTFATIGANLVASSATLAFLDLTGTQIEGMLLLGTGKQLAPIWKADASMILHNTRVGVIQDHWDGDAWKKTQKIVAWPGKLQLDGFIYDRLGGLTGGGENEMLGRDVEWYDAWLRLDPAFSPQPYRQLAKVFRAADLSAKADAILYAGRERKLETAWKARQYDDWFGLSLLKWTIGYGLGYRHFLALLWVAGLVLVGAAVLRVSGQGRAHKMPVGLAYSLDHLLPIVHLRHYHHEDVKLTGWARYYFYGHKLMGYVLASFLIAGLSGLTEL